MSIIGNTLKGNGLYWPFLIFFLVSTGVSAQDTSVTYRVETILKGSAKLFGGLKMSKTSTDVFHLNISKDLKYAEWIFEPRINNSQNSDVRITPKFTYVIKNLEDKVYLQEETMDSLIYVRGSLSKLKWEVRKDSVKTILDRECHFASARYNDSRISAWVMPSKFLEVGPAIFHGLPGVILALEYEDQNERILFSSIEFRRAKIRKNLHKKFTSLAEKSISLEDFFIRKKKQFDEIMKNEGM